MIALSREPFLPQVHPYKISYLERPPGSTLVGVLLVHIIDLCDLLILNSLNDFLDSFPFIG